MQQTLEGSFSAISETIMTIHASKYSFATFFEIDKIYAL